MKHLIGKTIKGFKLEGKPFKPNYAREMDAVIGKMGVITTVGKTYVRAEFEVCDGKVGYSYPLSEALNHIVEQHQQRGDGVLVWDKSENHPLPRIFLAYIGAKLPVQVVCPIDVEEFKNGNHFDTDRFKFYKPLPQKTKLTLLQKIADKFGIDVNELEVER